MGWVRVATEWVLGIVALAVIAWDIFAAAEPTPGDTVSRVMLDWGTAEPALPLAWGILTAHLFAPNMWGLTGWQYWTSFGGCFLLVSVVWFWPEYSHWLLGRYPLTWVVLGMVIGHRGWVQKWH